MPDGSERWLSAHADIRSNRVFGVNFDITRRKLAEEALAQSEARLRTATNAAALGVFEWDPVADKAAWGNDRIYQIFGRTPDDGPLSRAQFVADYLHPNDRTEFDTAVEKAIRTRGRFHVICRIKRRRGDQRWLEFEAKYEKATNERPARFVGVVADITNRKRIERRAERLSQQPSHRSRGGTAQYRAGASRLDSAAPRRHKPCTEHHEPATRTRSRKGRRHGGKFVTGGDKGAAYLQLSHASTGAAATKLMRGTGSVCGRLRRSFWVALQITNGPQARQIPTAGSTIDLAHCPRRIGQHLPTRFGLAGIGRRPASRSSTARRHCRQRTRRQRRLPSAAVTRRHRAPRHPNPCHSPGRRLRISTPPTGGMRMHAVLPTKTLVEERRRSPFVGQYPNSKQ